MEKGVIVKRSYGRACRARIHHDRASVRQKMSSIVCFAHVRQFAYHDAQGRLADGDVSCTLAICLVFTASLGSPTMFSREYLASSYY